jgi:hypothetical protein
VKWRVNARTKPVMDRGAAWDERRFAATGVEVYRA